MSNLVIVAIPEKDDYVWKISSEKVPHLTILFLGEATENPNVVKIQEFVEHAASTMLNPFWLDVSDRGVLGDDEADVLFFQDAWELPRVRSFRAALLKDPNIKKAYDSTEQFPEWNPHLTLGYPKAPAKEDPRDYPGIHSVRFDRIALWYGDFEGPEFKLQRPKYYEDALEVAMSTDGKSAVENILSHYGIKGMKWGVRRKNPSGPNPVVVSDTRKKLKAKGGEGHPATAEAVRAAGLNQKAKASGVKSLTNEELQTVITRMNLEQQVQRLNSNKQESAGKAFVKAQLKNKQNQQIAAKWALKKAAKAAAVAAV